MSANAYNTHANGTYASVTEQSGIKAGDGGFNVHVAGNTNLVGGVIESTQAAVDAARNSFSTDTLTMSDIANVDVQKGGGGSVSVSTDGSKPNGSSAGLSEVKVKEFINRQGQILVSLIVDLRDKKLSLNSFLRRLEGVIDILDFPLWNEVEFPIFSIMKEINAVAIGENRKLSREEEGVIEQALQSLEAAARQLLINSMPDDSES